MSLSEGGSGGRAGGGVSHPAHRAQTANKNGSSERRRYMAGFDASVQRGARSKWRAYLNGKRDATGKRRARNAHLTAGRGPGRQGFEQGYRRWESIMESSDV